jgi:energy-converting hydrogenase Eha subunit E
MFVWGGFQYLLSAGDDNKVKKGKETIKNAALGIVIIFLAYTAVNALIVALQSGTVT